MHGLIVELRDLDPVVAGQFDDLGGAGDARQVGTVANLAAVAFVLREEFLRPGDLLLRRRQSLVHCRALIGRQADFAGHAELGRDRGGLAELERTRTHRRSVDRAGEMRGLRGDGEPRPRVGQGRRMFAESGVATEVADPERQSESTFGGSDLGDPFQAACGLDQRDDRDSRQPFGGLGDVVDGFHHRQHHSADRGAGQHVQIVGPELGAEAVNPHPVAVPVGQPPHHVLPGGSFALRRHRILDIENHDVGAGTRRWGEPVVLCPVDQQPTSGQHRVDAEARVLGIRAGVESVDLVVHTWPWCLSCGNAAAP